MHACDIYLHAVCHPTAMSCFCSKARCVAAHAKHITLLLNARYTEVHTFGVCLCVGLAILMTLCGEVLFSSLLQSRQHLLGHGNQPDAEQSVLDEKQQAYSRMQVLRPPRSSDSPPSHSVAHLEALCILGYCTDASVQACPGQEVTMHMPAEPAALQLASVA